MGWDQRELFDDGRYAGSRNERLSNCQILQHNMQLDLKIRPSVARIQSAD